MAVVSIVLVVDMRVLSTMMYFLSMTLDIFYCI